MQLPRESMQSMNRISGIKIRFIAQNRVRDSSARSNYEIKTQIERARRCEPVWLRKQKCVASEERRADG